ncbi:uncharacterized membrane protein [[Candida] railenensis]|uniref:Uncharacterized membrane protein n=1 Tax=[Candida] railenensis TaxID=45579 RepID=A0A9P0QUV8_9ASCO|nr:uncharacterized membrane protein [[Candida] railenensis]
MSSIPTTQNIVLVNKQPESAVNFSLGEEDSTFKIVSKPFSESDLKDGQLLLKNLYFSNEPAQRGWMQKPDPNSKIPSRSYSAPIGDNDPVKCVTLSEVVLSKSEKFSVGDKLVGMFYWGDYSVSSEAAVFNKIDESLGVPLTYYLSHLGMTALTAYFGLVDIGKVQKGQTVVVSAASGATGSLAVQIAKNILGAGKVIGISGSDEKCRWVESLGADKCVNYKSDTFHDELRDAIGPDFADVYFDNVGGEILNYTLKLIKDHGIVVACGAIASYNDKSKGAITNWNSIVVQKLTVQGFIILEYTKRFPEAIAALSKGLKDGSIKAGEGINVVDLSKEENIWEQVPQVWKQLFTSKGNGKLITKVV